MPYLFYAKTYHTSYSLSINLTTTFLLKKTIVMKQIYFVLAFGLITFCSHGQSPFFHISTKKIDTTKTNYFGEALLDASKDNFSKSETFINYNPAISFDGESDYLEIDKPISDLSQMTIFTVFKTANDAISEAEVWGLQGEEATLGLTTKRAYSSSKQSFYTGVETDKAVLHTFLQLHRNTQPYPNKRTFISLGVTKKDSANTHFKGSIAEVIAYKRRIRGSKRQKIETALAIKYGITLSNGENYISSNKKVIWDSEEDIAFTNNIAGIGRDDDMELYQKQSSSSNEEEFLVISATEKAFSNKKNTSEIQNRTFLVWGDNNLDNLLEENSEEVRPALLNRKWFIKTTGSKAKEITTQLQIDAKELFDGLKAQSDYLLVIDRNGDGTFSEENTEYLQADTLTEEGILIFNNLNWDTDNSGSDVFTFTLKEDLVATLTPENALICPDASTLLTYEVEGGISPYSYSLKNSTGYSKEWTSLEDEELNHQQADILKGNYTLTVTDKLGTTTEVETTIEEDIPLTIDLGADKKLQFEEELVLEAQISDEEKVASYTWTKTASDFEETTPSITITEAGNYTLTVTTNLGCTYSDTIHIEESFIKKFILYPNPSTNGRYSVDVELAGRADIEVRVFNVVGTRLAKFKVKNKHKTTIKGKILKTSGLYEVVLYTPFETVTKKLIVK